MTPGSGESAAVNRPAKAGLLLGIVSVIVNPVLLVGLGAIVASAIGLNRAMLMSQHGYSAVGRTNAALGLILGLLGTVGSVVFKGSLF